MEKRILICGGCSYTAGGGFNNKNIFKLEFPTQKWFEDTIDFENIDFQNFISKYLWPHKLSELTNHDIVYNCGVGAKGPFSTLNILKDCILETKSNYPNSKIDVIYQIPESAREEIWYDHYNRPVCILTNFNDTDEVKKNFVTNFFNDNYSFFKQLHELYRFKKAYSSFGININFVCWDNKFTPKSVEIENLKRTIIKESEHENSKFWKQHTGNVFVLEKKSIDAILEYLNVIDFDGLGLQDYGVNKIDNFTFEQKYYNQGINDTHASKEGMEFISNLIFEKIFK